MRGATSQYEGPTHQMQDREAETDWLRIGSHCIFPRMCPIFHISVAIGGHSWTEGAMVITMGAVDASSWRWSTYALHTYIFCMVTTTTHYGR